MDKNPSSSGNIRYNRLQEQAILEAEKAKPTADPKYWAKPSCNQCYGRGVVGSVTKKVDTNTYVNSQLCICAKKRFVRWRDAWVAEFMKKNAEPAILESPAVVDNP